MCEQRNKDLQTNLKTWNRSLSPYLKIVFLKASLFSDNLKKKKY